MKDTVTYPLSAITGDEEESRIDQLERELVTARAEIERLKKRRDECSNGWDGEIATVQRLRRELADAVAKERERCARVCEEILHPDDSAKIEEKANWYAGTWACAAAIGKGE